MFNIFIIILLSTVLQAQMKPVDFMPPSKKGSQFMGITILDAKELSFKPINGIAFTEVSALAYDPERSRLYGLSDHGYLYHLTVSIKQEKLAEIKLLEAYKRRNKKGKRLKKLISEKFALCPSQITAQTRSISAKIIKSNRLQGRKCFSGRIR